MHVATAGVSKYIGNCLGENLNCCPDGKGAIYVLSLFCYTGKNFNIKKNILSC